MTPERFEALAEAYGGDVARWPLTDREAAAEWMAIEPRRAGAILGRAGDLDAALAAFAPPHASADLADRIVARAPRPRPRWVGWLWPAGMGAGLAAACVAGVLAGAQLAEAPAPSMDNEPMMTAVSDEDFSLYLDEEA